LPNAQAPLSEMSNKTPSTGSRGFIKSHFRRIVLEVINFLFNNDWFFAVIGRINKHGNFINSIFVAYPATQEYGDYYAYKFRLARNQWKPWLAGVLWQNKKLIVMFVISARDQQFIDRANKEQLRSLEARMNGIKSLLHAPYKTYAGILPGVLFLERIIRTAPEADFTATAVKQAIDRVEKMENLPQDTPIIVLGGRGFIGRRVVSLLEHREVHSVDLVANRGSWPSELTGKRALVINITKKGALDGYLDLMWPGVVIINEVYPEPSREVIGRINRIGCVCYNVVGVKAKAIPLFPLMYEGGIPCCAAWPADNFEVLVHKL